MFVNLFAVIHVISLILINIGALNQLFLIRKSKTISKDIPGKNTSQLSVKYRSNACFFFIVIILWGLSLEPIEWTVIFSRILAYIISILILYELWLDRRDVRAKYYFLICIAFSSFGFSLIFFYWNIFKNLSSFFGTLTIIFSFTLIIGLIDRVYKIIEAKSPGKQSLLEIVFQLIKDLSGIIYGFLVGFKTMWPLVIALCFLSIIRIANLLAYLYFSKTNYKILNFLIGRIKPNKKY